MGTHYKGTKEEIRALNAFIKLVRAGESAPSGAVDLMVKGGLTEGQFAVLDVLYHLGPMCQAELGRKNLRSRGNMTMVIDNLEKEGLVQRERDTDDRRFITVHITQKGKNLFTTIFPSILQEIVKLMNALSSSEQEELGRLCKKLALGKSRK